MRCFFAFTGNCSGVVSPAEGRYEHAAQGAAMIAPDGYCEHHRRVNMQRARWDTHTGVLRSAVPLRPGGTSKKKAKAAA
jgi:hypothetical protein